MWNPDVYNVKLKHIYKYVYRHRLKYNVFLPVVKPRVFEYGSIVIFQGFPCWSQFFNFGDSVIVLRSKALISCVRFAFTSTLTSIRVVHQVEAVDVKTSCVPLLFIISDYCSFTLLPSFHIQSILRFDAATIFLRHWVSKFPCQQSPAISATRHNSPNKSYYKAFHYFKCYNIGG